MSTFEPILIKASAGTGKTFRLTNRFIELLVAGERPENILATTFSVKAAGEIRERVFQRVAKAATSEEWAKKLSDELGKNISKGEAQDILRSLILQQHRLNINTLDSFFHKILSTFSLELGVCPNWTLDLLPKKEFNAEVLKKMCRTKDVSDLIYLFQNIDSKTSFINQVSSYLTNWHDVFLESNANAWQWIKLEKKYSDSDRKNLKEALNSLFYLDLTKSWKSAFEKDIINLEEDEFSPSGLCKNILNKNCSYYKSAIKSAILSVYIEYIKYKLSTVLEKLKGKNDSTYKLLSLFDVEYKNLRNITETLSFSDITDILQKASFRDDVEYIYYRLDTRIRHLLLDEFQDTSDLQWRIIEPIASEILAQCGVERSFFCVGDVKQAIYGWRGGRSEIFDTLKKRWDFLNVIEENESYRCSQPVLDSVNEVFSNLELIRLGYYHNRAGEEAINYTKFRSPEDLSAWEAYLKESPVSDYTLDKIISRTLENWQNGFKEHISKCKEANLGYVNFTILPKTEEDEDKDEVLYRNIYLTVRDIIERHPNYKVGILVRSNKVIPEIAKVFEREDDSLNVSVEGKSPLTNSPVIRACLAFLHLLDHPSDTVSAFHIATTPLGDALDLRDWHEGDFSERCLKWRMEISEIGFGEFFTKIARKLAEKCNKQELKILHRMAELGFTYSDWTNSRCEEFAKLIEHTEIVNIKEANVVIMTIHRSKGLEFDAVILPELTSKLLENRGFDKNLYVLHDDEKLSPVAISHKEKWLEGQNLTIDKMLSENQTLQLNEELCILYVAMTRAKRELYLLSQFFDYTSREASSLSYVSLLCDVLKINQQFEGDDVHTGVVYEKGNKEYVLDEEGDNSSLGEKLELSELRYRKRAYPRMQTNKPSKLENRGVVSLNNLLSTKNKSAINVGSLVHSMMQSVEWLDNIQDQKCLYDENVVAKVIKQLNCTEEEISWAKKVFERSLKMESVISALSRKQYGNNCSLELFREQRFSIRDSKTSILSGAFDRLVAISVNGKVIKGDVIDFKTDKIESSIMLSKKAEYYRPQLLAYRTATAKFLNIAEKDVSLRLLFVRSGDIITF